MSEAMVSQALIPAGPLSDSPLTREDWDALRAAHRRLERPSFAARASAILGGPLEKAGLLLPPAWRMRVDLAVRLTLDRAARMAISSIPEAGPAQPLLHRAAGAGLGAVGGFFGPAGLVAELPLSTMVMLRAIADAARAEGEDLSQFQARFACLEVFGLGGRTSSDDAAESGYYAARTAIAAATSNLAHGVGGASAPVVGRLVAAIAERFGVVVTQKTAAQLAPVLGAAAGAAINLAFVDHFESTAKGHFALRRLERVHGAAVVARAYNAIGREN